MSLYLTVSTTSETIRQAKAAGITGVKSYPAGVTTNSASGVTDYASFYPVFSEMETEDLILNLHGECQSGNGINELNAEAAFLPTLLSLHQRFPKLRIVLEHCTTAAALEAVKQCGPTVAGTITTHHLFLTEEDWRKDPFCFCKPVAKLSTDRDELLKAVVSGNPKFFLGTDSAPHSVAMKQKGAAGVFTQPNATQLVLDALEGGIERGVLQEKDITKETLEGYLGGFGRAFYHMPETRESMILAKGQAKVKSLIEGPDEASKVLPFRAGKITYSLEWNR
jgi:dihydroorotase